MGSVVSFLFVLLSLSLTEMFHCCATEIRLDEAQVTISINAIKNVKKPEEVEVNKISCTAATCDVNKTNIVMQE